MNELCTLSATELAARIRRKEASPSEVLEAHIERIEAVNPLINAVVAQRFDAARAEAAEATERLAHDDDLPPFFGVPCTIKELIAVTGMPHTAGVVARQHIVAEADAPQVERLKAAGAIVMGVTNISESGLWLESVNKVYGRTNNPWDVRRMAGGSTGGEAAIIAAGGSPFGLGADIGGSIRNPCFFNGIPGHKPSGGYLPATGHWPPAEGQRGRYCVTGPMARTVSDLIGMMQILSTEADPHRDAGVPRFAPVEPAPAEVTVSWFVDNGVPLAPRCDDDVRNAMSTTLDALRDLGFRVDPEPFVPAGLHHAAEIWGARLAVTGDPPVSVFLGNDRRAPLGREWARWLRRRSNHQLISLLMASFEWVTDASPARTAWLNEVADAMVAEITERLGPNGVLICPVYPRSAPRHRVPHLLPTAFAYCGLINVLELASTAVPTGFDRRGMPLGLQVVAARHRDPLSLAVARHVEQAWGGWRPAPVA